MTNNNNKILKTLSIATLGIITSTAYADEARGLAWLQSQNQEKVTSSEIASQLKSLSETTHTLKNLANTTTTFDLADITAKSTEGLARLAFLNHYQQGDTATRAVLWSKIKDRQNADGGFNHRSGWQSNPLDTAYVLIALSETDYINSLAENEQSEWQAMITNALAYLANQQRADGSFQVIKLEKLYVSSYVLSALTKHVKNNSNLILITQKLVQFLTDKQIESAKWSDQPTGLFIDALVAESLHPYQTDDVLKKAFKERVYALQDSDGSWQDDTYVTAVVLDALEQQKKDTANPVTSSISLSVVDAETGLPLQGATLKSSADSPSQIDLTADNDGGFLASDTKAGLYSFTVTRAGYNSITFEVRLQQGEQLNVDQLMLSRLPVDIDNRYSQLKGSVVDKKDQVVSGANLTIITTDKNGKKITDINPINLQTDINGQYSITLPQAGHYKVVASKQGYIPVDSSIQLDLGQTGTLNAVIGLLDPSNSSPEPVGSNPSVIKGIATDRTTGKPLGNTSITIKYINTANEDKNILVKTDVLGKYEIESDYEGKINIIVSRDDYDSISTEYHLKNNMVVAFNPVMTKISADKPVNAIITQIQGLVTDAKTNAPIADSLISVTMIDDTGKPISNQKPVTVKTSNSGTYQAILPQSGKFTISVKKDGYITINMNSAIKIGQTALLSPKLTNQADFSASAMGKVTDSDGKPLVNTTVKQDNKILATTDATGSFNISSISKGSQKLTFEKEGYLTASTNISIKQSAVYDVGIVALPQQQQATPDNPNPPTEVGVGMIEVSAKDSRTKELIMGISITAEKLDAQGNVIQTQSFSPADDRATGGALSLPEGKWKITVDHSAYGSASKVFTLKDDDKLVYTPTLTLDPYTLTGKLVDSQTNEVIANAPITVIDTITKQTIYTGKTDVDGIFAVTKAIRNSPEIEVLVNPPLYLETTRYVVRDLDEENPSTNLDMGEIRLRPKSAQVILPDLTFFSTDTSNITTDQRTLDFEGKLTAQLVNKGNATLYPQDVQITAFKDTNNNRQLDDNEAIYGKTLFNGKLQKNEEATIELDVQGKSDFREAPIALIVDTDKQVIEEDESNNVRLTSDGVEIKPKQGTLEAEVVWKANFPSVSGAIAAPLEDSNGDGKIGHGDVSSIIVYSGGYYRILDGKTGEKKFDIKGNGSQELAAIADLDNDGIPEIVAKNAGGITVYSNKGDIIKNIKGNATPSGWASSAIHPNIADIDGDGIPEIILNNYIYNFKAGTSKKITDESVQAVVDVNDDGFLDLITRKGTFDKDGNRLYNFHEKNRKHQLKFVAVGDVLGSGDTQVVSIYGSEVSIFNAQTGALITKYNPTSSAGGSPVIADFDGDGISDIGIARSYRYVAMRGDGSEIWSTPINDGSGGTGSTVFDFDNDGNMEAVHFDERNLRIYDAKTGVERIKLKNGYNSTAHEYPIVGDFDADGHADIIITSNGFDATRMISSKNKDWANTRNIWNQYSYHVTNINDDLSVPKNELNSWEVHNTYRANLLLNQNATAASDLTTSYIRVEDNTLTNSKFTARIGNAGGKPVAIGTPVSFYRVPQVNGQAGTPELVGTKTLTKTLVGGNIAESYEDVTLEYSGSLDDFGELVVVANDAGAGLESQSGIVAGTEDTTKVVQEYSRDNNTARLAIDGGWGALTLDGSVDKPEYQANTEVVISAIPANLGSFPSSPIIKTQIIDSTGNVVATLPDQKVELTSALIADPDNSKTLKQRWNTTTTRAGTYTARISLWKDSSIFSDELEQVMSIDRPFAIVAQADTANPLSLTNSSITADKASYTANDIVNINSRIQNTASNQEATQRDILVEIKDSNGAVIFNQNYSYTKLNPNELKDKAFQVSLKDAKAGNYTVTQTTTTPDGSQDTQINITRFTVESSSATGIGITGTIAPDKSQVELGGDVTLNWSVSNTGDVDLTAVPLRIELFTGNIDKPFASVPITARDISKNGSINSKSVWKTIGKDKDQITAILVANFKDSQGQLVEKGLAVTQFTLIEPPLEVSINTTQPSAESLLVYYGCKEGWKTYYKNSSGGAFNFPCFNERANTLMTYLNRQNVPYKLIKKPTYFADQLQSGLYKQVWLLGGIEELRPHTRKELTETTYLGNNLVMDSGMNSWVNQDLFNLGGVNVGKRLLLENYTLNPTVNFLDAINQFNPEPAVMNTPLVVHARTDAGHPFYGSWSMQFTPHAGTDVWASFTGKRKRGTRWLQNREPNKSYPAVVSKNYGKGQPVALAFDLISTLDKTTKTPSLNDDKRWDSVLSQLLSKRRPINPSDYVPNDVVRIPIDLNNKGSTPQELTITVELPQGAKWLDNQGGLTNPVAQSQPDNKVTYSVTLSAKESIKQSLALRLPVQSGTHGVRITISNANKKVLAEQEMQYLVRDINSRITLLDNTIKHWHLFSHNGQHKIAAKTNLLNIKTHRATGVKQLAVYEASRLATKLRYMQRSDNSAELQQLRYEADELLRALQMDWYIARNGYVPPL